MSGRSSRRGPAPGEGAGEHVGPRLDPVRMTGCSALWSSSTPSTVIIGEPCPLIFAHVDEAIAKIDDLRLTGGLLDRGDPPRERRGHHHVRRAEDARTVGRAEEDRPPRSPGRRLADDVTVLDPHLRPESTQPLQVDVDGADAEGAAAREAHFAGRAGSGAAP